MSEDKKTSARYLSITRQERFTTTEQDFNRCTISKSPVPTGKLANEWKGSLALHRRERCNASGTHERVRVLTRSFVYTVSTYGRRTGRSSLLFRLESP